VAIFINRGAGKYDRFIIPSAGGWVGLTMADLNGDGKADLVLANYDNENITICLTK
jgi:hypothetical protein